MVTVIFDDEFKKQFKKIKDVHTKEKIVKQVAKLKNNPELGKPMRFSRKGTRELCINPYRLSYFLKKDTIYLLTLYHKDNQ